MSQIIYKYPIPVDDNVVLQIPQNAKVLTVQTQKGQTCIWCLLNPEEDKISRSFEIHGTGNMIKELEGGKSRQYVGTFQLFGGDLVLHVFEILNPYAGL